LFVFGGLRYKGTREPARREKDMTRETKIGMIVAGSFLSLVGVVVGTKLYKRDQPVNEAPQTAASTMEPGKAPLAPGGATPNESTPPGKIALAQLTTPGALPPLMPPPGSPSSDLTLPPPTGPIGLPPGVDPVAAELLAAKEREKHRHDGVADLPIPTVGNPPSVPAPTIDTGRNGVADLGKPPVSGIAALPPIDRNGFPVPPLTRQPDLTAPPAVMVAQGKPTPPPGGIDLPPVAGPPSASPAGPPSAPSSPPPPISSVPPAPPAPPIGSPPPVAPPPTNTAPIGPPPAPISGPPIVTPPHSGPDAIVPPPSSPNNIAPPPPAPIARDPVPSPPPFNSGPPTPPPPASITGVPPPPAPIANVPPLAPPTPPAVVVGDEQRYVVKPTDSYGSISRNAYGDDRYAAALQEYNRSRLGASAPATLQPGTEIVIPTAASLQNSRFGVLIAAMPTPPPPAPPAPPPPPPPATSPAALAPVATVPTVPPAPPFPSPSPPFVAPSPANVAPSPPPYRDPVTIGPVTSPAAQPATPTAPQPAGATYRIPAGGKLIAQVAQEQLGSPLRWIDIYRLNSNLDPSRPIPEGTEIRLPPR
jgi:LysM domain